MADRNTLEEKIATMKDYMARKRHEDMASPGYTPPPEGITNTGTALWEKDVTPQDMLAAKCLLLSPGWENGDPSMPSSIKERNADNVSEGTQNAMNQIIAAYRYAKGSSEFVNGLGTPAIAYVWKSDDTLSIDPTHLNFARQHLAEEKDNPSCVLSSLPLPPKTNTNYAGTFPASPREDILRKG